MSYKKETANWQCWISCKWHLAELINLSRLSHPVTSMWKTHHPRKRPQGQCCLPGTDHGHGRSNESIPWPWAPIHMVRGNFDGCKSPGSWQLLSSHHLDMDSQIPHLWQAPPSLLWLLPVFHPWRWGHSPKYPAPPCWSCQGWIHLCWVCCRLCHHRANPRHVGF